MSSSIEQPYMGPNDEEFDLFEYAESEEYSDLTERIRQFDEVRKAAYGQVERIMIGSGGDTASEAVSTLEALTLQTAKSFSDVALAALGEYSTERYKAVWLIAQTYVTDEEERLKVLKKHHDEQEYTATSLEDTLDYVTEILAADKEDLTELFDAYYGACFTKDMNDCLEAAPENSAELAAEKRQVRREMIKEFAIDTVKMASAALLAATIMRRFNK